MAIFSVPNQDLYRYEQEELFPQSFGPTRGYAAQGKSESKSTFNGIASYWRTEFAGQVNVRKYNINHDKYRITKVKISFFMPYIATTGITELKFYLGISSSQIRMLMQGEANYTERLIYLRGNSWGGSFSSYDKITLELNQTQIEKFQKYFIENKSFTIYEPDDRNWFVNLEQEYPDSPYADADSPNRANFQDFTLEVEYAPKATTFSKLPETIVIGSENTFEINSLGENYTYQTILTLGSKTLSSEISNSTTLSLNVPQQWGKELSSSYASSGTVSLITYLDGAEVGRNSSSLSYIVPPYDLKPSDLSIENLVQCYQLVDGEISNMPVYLKDLSRIAIKFNSTNLKRYGAEITKTIKLNYDEVLGEDVINLLDDQYIFTLGSNVLIELQVIDSRGVRIGVSKTFLITENTPSFKNSLISRCNETGKLSTTGKNIRLSGQLAHGTLSMKQRNEVTGDYSDSIILKEKIDEQTQQTYWYTDTNQFSEDKAYYFELAITSSNYYIKNQNDSTYDPLVVLQYLEISSSAYLIHFLNSGLGLGLGCAAQNNNEITLGWKARFKKGLSLVEPLSPESGGIGFNSILGLWNHISSLTSGQQKNDNYVLDLGVSKLEAKSISIESFNTNGEIKKYPVYPFEIVEELPEVGVPGIIYLLKQ